MIIASIQNVTSYTCHPIYQKFLQIAPEGWKEKMMLVGLMISICCAIITFFTRTAFICLAFCVLSGICGLGALYMHRYENCKKMQEQIETLQKENQIFNAHNQALVIEKEKLQTEITRLDIYTSHLMKASQELILSVEDLRVNLVVLEPIVKGYQEIEKKLETFSIKMDEQQQVSQGLMELISKIEQSDQLALKREILHQLQALQSNDMTLQKLKELSALQEQLASTREQLSSTHDKLRNTLKEHADVQSKMAETSHRLSFTQEQNRLEIIHLQEERQKLDTILKELKETQKSLNALLLQHRSFSSEKN